MRAPYGVGVGRPWFRDPIPSGNVPGEQGASPRRLSHLCSPARQCCCTLSPSSPAGSILAAVRSQAATLCMPESQETSLGSRHSKWLLLLGCPKLNPALGTTPQITFPAKLPATGLESAAAASLAMPNPAFHHAPMGPQWKLCTAQDPTIWGYIMTNFPLL